LDEDLVDETLHHMPLFAAVAIIVDGDFTPHEWGNRPPPHRDAQSVHATRYCHKSGSLPVVVTYTCTLGIIGIHDQTEAHRMQLHISTEQQRFPQMQYSSV
jgi:hypothetical protein